MPGHTRAARTTPPQGTPQRGAKRGRGGASQQQQEQQEPPARRAKRGGSQQDSAKAPRGSRELRALQADCDSQPQEQASPRRGGGGGGGGSQPQEGGRALRGSQR